MEGFWYFVALLALIVIWENWQVVLGVIIVILLFVLLYKIIKAVELENDKNERNFVSEFDSYFQSFFKEYPRDYEKLTSYINKSKASNFYSSQLTTDKVVFYRNRIEYDIENYYKNADYKRLKNLEVFIKQHCSHFYTENEKTFNMFHQITKFFDPKELLILNNERKAIDLLAVERYRKMHVNVTSNSIQEILWHETLRDDFNKYSYEKIHNAIYDKLANKTSVELFLSEEYVKTVHKTKLEKRYDQDTLIKSLSYDDKAILEIGKAWIEKNK